MRVSALSLGCAGLGGVYGEVDMDAAKDHLPESPLHTLPSALHPSTLLTMSLAASISTSP